MFTDIEFDQTKYEEAIIDCKLNIIYAYRAHACHPRLQARGPYGQAMAHTQAPLEAIRSQKAAFIPQS